MLRRVELEVLATVDRGDTISELASKLDHSDFPELLTGKALEVLYYLDQPRTVAAIADRSDNYRNTVNRVLKRFRNRGLVGSVEGHYEFNADFDRFHTFT